jgi:hypothetical protein
VSGHAIVGSWLPLSWMVSDPTSMSIVRAWPGVAFAWLIARRKVPAEPPSDMVLTL